MIGIKAIASYLPKKGIDNYEQAKKFKGNRYGEYLQLLIGK